jgi:hypothetical protein
MVTSQKQLISFSLQTTPNLAFRRQTSEDQEVEMRLEAFSKELDTPIRSVNSMLCTIEPKSLLRAQTTRLASGTSRSPYLSYMLLNEVRMEIGKRVYFHTIYKPIK